MNEEKRQVRICEDCEEIYGKDIETCPECLQDTIIAFIIQE